MASKKMLYLANSRKHSGRCVAGREVIAPGKVGSWIRPISGRPTHELSPQEQAYSDGSEPKLGDILILQMKHAAPKEYQTENWVFDDGHCWTKTGQATWAEVKSLAEHPMTLWQNGDSTYDGLNDEMKHAVAAKLTSSLCMIHVTDLVVHVCVTGAAFGNPKKRVQGRFTHRGVSYWLWVTDIAVEADYQKRPVGQYHYGECCLTISVSEPHKKSSGEEYVYKLIAAVIPPA
jgi:hypothetical protein